MRANEEWRKDPEMVAAARSRYEQRTAQLEEVAALLKKALEISAPWATGADWGLDSYLNSVRHHIFSARMNMDWWIESNRKNLANPDTATFTNMAAFGQVE